jgi:hypothetical protein
VITLCSIKLDNQFRTERKSFCGGKKCKWNEWLEQIGRSCCQGAKTPSKYSYTDQRVYDGASATKVVFYRIRSMSWMVGKYIPGTFRLSATSKARNISEPG